MPTSGGGTGTPISSGAVPTAILAAPLPWTILSLHQFAKVLGINPAHFWQATTASFNPIIMPVDQCGSLYHQYAWQDADKVSRYDIAKEIARAEKDIAQALGYWPGPAWTFQEHYDYPRHHRRELFSVGLDARFMSKNIHLKRGKIISPGKRAVALIGSPDLAHGNLVYSDEDSDGFYETAVVFVSTTHADIRDLHVYHYGKNGHPEWEIRPARQAYIDAGVAYFIFDSYQFINPDLYEQPSLANEERVILIDDTSNYVEAVDVYHEYADLTDESVVFYWENESVGCGLCGGAGCSACGYVMQEGCLRINNSDEAIVTPVPASYDAENGWIEEGWSGGREPDRMEVWYRSGLLSDEYLEGRSHNPLSLEMARIIAHLTVARLERPLCGCSNLQNLSEYLRKNTTSNEGAGGMFFTTINVVNNPFGTRVGEVEAWRYITKLAERRAAYAVV